MPGAESMIEAEMLANGGDERAARALVAENTEQTLMAAIRARVEQAENKVQTKAA